MKFSEVPKEYRRVILGRMSPGDWDLLEEGFSPEEQDMLRGAIKSTRRRTELELGDPLAPTPDLSESLKNVETVTHTFVGVTSPMTFMLAVRRAEDEFRYATSPAARTIARGGSDLARALGDAIYSAEEHRHSFGSTLRNISYGAGWALQAGRGISAYLRNAKTASQALTWARRLRNAKNIITVIGGGGGLGGILLSYAIGEVVYRVGMYAIKDYAYKKAGQEFAARVFDKSRLMDELAPLVGVTPMTGGAYDESRRLLTQNPLAGSRLMGQLELPDDFNDMNLLKLGYGYQDAAPLLRRYIPHLSASHDDASELISIGGMLAESFGGDIDGVMSPLSSLARIGKTDKDKITEEFLGFFGALSGDGSLITSQLELVTALTEFSRVYGYLGKMNVNAPQHLARVANLLGESETVSIQSAEAIARGVSSLDDMLMAGATLANPQANLLLAQSGITRQEAIRGLTGDASLLDKMLGGISSMAGIGHKDYGADGKLQEGALYRLASFMDAGFGNQVQDIGFVVDALEARYRGGAYDPSDHHQATLTSSQQAVANLTLAAKSAPIRLLNELAEQNILFSEAVLKNAKNMIHIDDVVHEVLSRELFSGHLVADFSSDIMRIMDIYHKPISIKGTLGKVVSGLNFGTDAANSRRESAAAMERAGPVMAPPGALGADRFSGYAVTSMPGYKYGKEVPEVLWGQLHQGIDYVVPGGGHRGLGASVYSPFSDDVTVIKKVKEEDSGGQGNYIVVRAASGAEYKMLHFDTLPEMAINTKIAPGGFIGRQGQTGVASGPHVHLALNYERGDPNNPNFSQEEFFTQLSIDAPDFVKAVFPEMYRLYGPRDGGMSSNPETRVNIEIKADYIDSKEGLARYLVDRLEMFA